MIVKGKTSNSVKKLSKRQKKLASKMDDKCPLCLDIFEPDDVNFFPCQCGYQICRFCWHRIRTNENGLCPHCRRQYAEDPANFKPLSPEELAKLKNEKKKKEIQKKKEVAESRKQLANIRVVQKNLIFVHGLPVGIDTQEEKYRRLLQIFKDCGPVIKCVVNNKTNYAGAQVPRASVYVTYQKIEDALRAYKSLPSKIEDYDVKTSLGTTKYCSNFLKNVHCPKQDCMYLHESADEELCFTKEQIHAGEHLAFGDTLYDKMMSSHIHSKSSISKDPVPSDQEVETQPKLNSVQVKDSLNGHSPDSSNSPRQNNTSPQQSRLKHLFNRDSSFNRALESEESAILRGFEIFDYMESVLKKEKNGDTSVQQSLSEESTVNNIHGTVNNIHVSVNSIHGSVSSIHGTTNSIHGTASNIHGTASNIHGAASNIHGAASNIHGAASNVHGAASNIHGAASNVHGAANSIHGAASNVHGAANSIHGAANSIHGAVNSIHVNNIHGTVKSSEIFIHQKSQDVPRKEMWPDQRSSIGQSNSVHNHLNTNHIPNDYNISNGVDSASQFLSNLSLNHHESGTSNSVRPRSESSDDDLGFDPIAISMKGLDELLRKQPEPQRDGNACHCLWSQRSSYVPPTSSVIPLKLNEYQKRKNPPPGFPVNNIQPNQTTASPTYDSRHNILINEMKPENNTYNQLRNNILIARMTPENVPNTYNPLRNICINRMSPVQNIQNSFTPNPVRTNFQQVPRYQQGGVSLNGSAMLNGYSTPPVRNFTPQPSPHQAQAQAMQELIARSLSSSQHIQSQSQNVSHTQYARVDPNLSSPSFWNVSQSQQWMHAENSFQSQSMQDFRPGSPLTVRRIQPQLRPLQVAARFNNPSPYTENAQFMFPNAQHNQLSKEVVHGFP